MAVSQTLTLTEVAGSTNLSANTSKVRILWKSTQSGDSWNGYTRTAKYYISINGEAEREYTVSYTLPQASTNTILDTTISVTHKGDGSGTVKVRTWMDTRISAGVVEKTQSLTLTTIPRASTITSASNITLGTPCAIRWTPLSTAFRYKLNFSLSGYSYTTGAIHPNTIAAYTYTGYTPSIADVAPKITSKPPTGTMTVTLYTYSDSNASVQIGSASSTTFTVTVPDNESTKPTVTMTLSPVTPYTKFASLYLQGRSKVKATFSGSGKYGASVTSYNMQADEVNYASPYTSDTLKKSGSVTIVGTATDSRGFSGTSSQSINVIAYDPPYIAPSEGYKSVVCERSTSDGTPSDKGTYLHIKGTRNYTKINTNGIVNTCSVRCRYKPEGGSWSHDPGEGVGVLLWTDTSTDEFDVLLPDIVSNTMLSYMVELNIIDDTYTPSAMVFNIPSEAIDFELREGGKGAAFGKHAVTENLLECTWDAKFHKGLSMQGEPVADFIVEQGIIGNWYCRKWYSGFAECWYKRNADVNVDAKWGTALYYGTVAATYYPFTFAEIPSCQITCEYGTDNVSLFPATSGNSSTGRTPTVMLCRTDAKLVNVNIQYYAYGRWK